MFVYCTYTINLQLICFLFNFSQMLNIIKSWIKTKRLFLAFSLHNYAKYFLRSRKHLIEISKIYFVIFAENGARSDEIFINPDTLMSFTAAAGRKSIR